jgi:glycosyltransferase involved in cell wall biosynthesis
MPTAGLHICHVSLLNPAIHSRIFFKMAQSQVRAGHRVTIIAQDPAAHPYERAGVHIIPLGVFGRLSWRRMLGIRTVEALARGVAADIYQIHTVELLPMAHRLKSALAGCKVIFDMHEDYVANILYADYYADYIRRFLARRVQAVLDAFPAWGDGLILAEDCFKGLVAFDPERLAIVRNKFQFPQSDDTPQPQGPGGLPFMLLTGTIAANWGVWESIALWEALNRRQPLGLVIAGHGQDRRLMAQVAQRVAQGGLQDRFRLAGGATYLPFETVVKYIQACTFGLALYAIKENIKDRIPTKFYEFMAHRKPLLFTPNPPWMALNAQYDFGVALQWPPSAAALEEIYQRCVLGDGAFYRRTLPDAAWQWESEAVAMLDLIAKIAH